MMHIMGSKTLGGAERFYLRLVESLHLRGERVAAVLRRGSEVVGQVPNGITVVESPMRTVWDPFSKRAITRSIDALAPQIVQTYMGRATRLTRLEKSNVLHVARLGGFRLPPISRRESPDRHRHRPSRVFVGLAP